MKNKNLNIAKKAKNDEFYTQLTDIENELIHYKNHFKDKIVYCNCDDYSKSNFFKYFYDNFHQLGLKKLISTNYIDQSIDLLFTKNIQKPTLAQYTGNTIDVQYLNGNGDFSSKECIDLLKQADIVVTNPPFSLFREYVAQLVEYDKKFIILGNMNAITYKDIFKLIKEDKLWIGPSIHSGDREFGVPPEYPLNSAGYRNDDKGNNYIRVKGVRWFTNLDFAESHEDIILYKKYNSQEYPTYDNYDAINVNVTKDIPMDYAGVMGVPITFLDKYNPDQFEILGNEYDLNIEKGRGYINGKRLYSRLFIRNKRI